MLVTKVHLLLTYKYYLTFICTTDFGLPTELKTQVKNPHCLNVTWKKATGPVTGYRIHCFPGDSEKAEIVHEILNGKKQSAIISGLKPEVKYRVGISSVSSGNESKLVLTDDQPRMRKLKSILNKPNVGCWRGSTKLWFYSSLNLRNGWNVFIMLNYPGLSNISI